MRSALTPKRIEDAGDFFLDRRLSWIQRWHHRPVPFPENLAEHVAYVARISIMVCDLLLLTDFSDQRHKDAMVAAVARIALYHDEAETLTGDIAGSWKALHPGAKKVTLEWEQAALDHCFLGLPDELADHYRQLVANYGIDDEPLEHQIVRYSDKVTALSFIIEAKAQGSTRLDDIEKQLQSTVTRMSYPWLEQLRREFGVP